MVITAGGPRGPPAFASCVQAGVDVKLCRLKRCSRPPRERYARNLRHSRVKVHFPYNRFCWLRLHPCPTMSRGKACGVIEGGTQQSYRGTVLCDPIAFLGLVVVRCCRLCRPGPRAGLRQRLQNVMGPASGGMAGVSTARPQDVPSAIFGNPATLAQFEGTQFTLGGGWMEGYPTVSTRPARYWHALSAPRRGRRAPRPPRSAWPRIFAPSVWPAPSAWASPVSAAAGPSIAATRRAPDQQRERPIPGVGINLGAGFQVTDRLSVGAT